MAGKDKVANAMASAASSSPATLRSALFEALNVQKNMKRVLRHVQDVVEIRTTRVITEWTGGAVELMRELQVRPYFALILTPI